MSRFKTFSICVILAIAAHALGDQLPLRVAPTDGVLVLRNGEVIEGKIARAGDRFFVTVTAGEIRVKAEDVAMVCKDMSEAYQQKRTGLTANDVYGRIELAKWCLHHRMISQAAREMAEIAALDPKNPSLAVLERQIATLRAGQARPATTATSESPAKPRSADRAPSTDDLDSLVRYLPDGTVETYTTTIQPLLMNRCMTSGCHSVRSQAQMHLYRPSPGHRSNRRLTQRNLYAVLQQIDRSNPSESPLLKTPLKPHGTARTPIFPSIDDPHYRQVLNWIQQLGNGGEIEAETPERSARKTSSTGKIARRMSSAKPSPMGEPGSSYDSGESPTPKKPTGREKPAGRDKPNAPAPNEPADEKAEPSSDPFDPEVFNRRFSTPAPSTANR